MLKKRTKSNRGDSHTISYIFVTLLLLAFTVTAIDISMSFNNQNTIELAAQNGAKTVGLFTGVANNGAISNHYGFTGAAGDCAAAGATNPIECSVYKEIVNSNSLVGNTKHAGAKGPATGSAVIIHDITCGPDRTQFIGDRTYCTVKWQWDGLPGSSWSFIARNNVFETTATGYAEAPADDL